MELTAHFHNTRGQGLANVLAALGAGVRSFESSFGELGGCPVPPGATGNIASEDLVSMLHEMGYETGIDLDSARGVRARGAARARPPARQPCADGRARWIGSAHRIAPISAIARRPTRVTTRTWRPETEERERDEIEEVGAAETYRTLDEQEGCCPPAEQRFERQRRTVGLFLGPIVLAAMLLIPFDLDGNQHRLAAILAFVVVWWVTEAIPIPMTALLAVARSARCSRPRRRRRRTTARSTSSSACSPTTR